MAAVVIASPGPVFIDPNQQTVHDNATVIASDSDIFSGFGTREIALIINVVDAPTGITPSITFTLEEIDPGDLTTSLGTTITGSAIVGSGTQIIRLPLTLSGTVKVSWVVTGAGASFTGVYSNIITKTTTSASGVDGTNVERVILVDSSGRPIFVGAGVAGTPAGGVLTVQGDPAGTPIPVSGDFSNTSVGVDGAASPAASTQIGGTDGIDLQAAHVFDVDSGGGTEYVLGTNLRKIASGGSVEAGTLSDPLRVDPTGGTTQPVSQNSFWVVDQGTTASAPDAWSVRLSDGGGFYIAAQTGQFPSALVSGRLDTNIGSWLGSTSPTVGSKTSADSLPVVVASDQGAISVTLPIDVSPVSQDITTQDLVSSTTVGANLQSIITGVATTNSVATFTLSSWETAQLQVIGVWIGTLQTETSSDGGTTWYVHRLHQTGIDSTNGAFTSNFSGSMNVSGCTHVRVRAIAAITGTATVSIVESDSNSVVYVGNAQRITDNSGNYLTFDSSGRITIVGADTAGTTIGGVLSIQGVVGGIPQSIAGVNRDTGIAYPLPLSLREGYQELQVHDDTARRELEQQTLSLQSLLDIETTREWPVFIDSIPTTVTGAERGMSVRIPNGVRIVDTTGHIMPAGDVSTRPIYVQTVSGPGVNGLAGSVNISNGTTAIACAVVGAQLPSTASSFAVALSSAGNMGRMMGPAAPGAIPAASPATLALSTTVTNPILVGGLDDLGKAQGVSIRNVQGLQSVPVFDDRLRDILEQMLLVLTDGSDPGDLINRQASLAAIALASTQPTNSYVVTPNDDTQLGPIVTKGLKISNAAGATTATVAFKLIGDSAVSTYSVGPGVNDYMPGNFSRVMSTGTTLPNGCVLVGLGG